METPKPQIMPKHELPFTPPISLAGSTVSSDLPKKEMKLKKGFVKKPFQRPEHLTHRPFAGLKYKIKQ